LRDAIELPIDRALARERASFLDLVASEESKAQRHIFFAEREAAKAAGAGEANRRRSSRPR
jgi:hypothetical protein